MKQSVVARATTDMECRNRNRQILDGGVAGSKRLCSSETRQKARSSTKLPRTPRFGLQSSRLQSSCLQIFLATVFAGRLRGRLKEIRGRLREIWRTRVA